MKLKVGTRGIILGYLCDSCKGYNDILTIHCSLCKTYSDISQTFRWKVAVEREISIQWGGEDSSMTNDERIELHSKFYKEAGEQIALKAMDYRQCVEWEEQLEHIIIEAKAKAQRSQQHRRELKDRMSKEERDRLITLPDLSIKEGILVPAQRKSRQSDADKMVAEMTRMGMSPDDINKLMVNIIPAKMQVSEKKDSNGEFKFTKENPVEPAGEPVRKPVNPDPEKKPLDFGSLFGKK